MKILQKKDVLPMPDVLTPIKEYGHRCEECNAKITGQKIIIVREDRYFLGGSQEDVLYESINCHVCGHQNIIGRYYRPYKEGEST